MACDEDEQEEQCMVAMLKKAMPQHWCPLREPGTSEERREKGGNEKRSYRSRERKDNDLERHSTLGAKSVRAGDASPPFMDSAEEHN